MKVKIIETGELKTLAYTHNGVNCAYDIVGNAGALTDGSITWVEEEGYYLASQAEYEWWVEELAALRETADLISQIRDRAQSLEDLAD